MSKFLFTLLLSTLLTPVAQAVDPQADLTAYDLVLTESSVTPGNYSINVSYANLGDLTIDPSVDSGTNSVYVNGSGMGGYAWGTLSDSSFLNAGTSLEGALAFPSEVALSNGDEVEVCIDSTDLVLESDESNNCVSTTLIAEIPELPDLVVDSVSVDPSDYSLNIVVTNVGEGAVDEAVNPLLGLSITTPDFGPAPYVTYELLDYATLGADFRMPGESTVISIPDREDEYSVSALCDSGLSDDATTWGFDLTVDYDAVVEESDETNNGLSTSFNVCAQPSLPDLTVTNVAVDPLDYSLDITVMNAGEADVGEDADPVMTLSIETPEGASPPLPYDLEDYITEDADFRLAGSSMVVSLPADEDESFVDFCLSRESVEESTWTFTVVVDSEEVVEESDETNNEFVSTFDVCADVDSEGEESDGGSSDEETLLPDLVIESVTLNDDNTLHFVVSNQGTADLDSETTVDLSLYDLTSGTGAYPGDEYFVLNDLGTSFMPVGGSIEFDSTYVIETLPTSILAVVDPANNVEELTDDEFEANYYRATFEAPADETDSDGVPLPAGTVPVPSSHGGSSSSNGGTVNGGSADDAVELTEDELEACGTMTFEDVSEDDPDYDTIYAMWCAGVIHGRDATHFAPADYVKRDEVAKIVGRFFGFVTAPHEEIPTVEESTYEDVSTDEPLVYYVETLTEEGFFEGEVEAGVYRPHEDMTYAEIVDLLSQVTGSEVSTEGYEQDEGMTRGAFMSFIYSLAN